jgi:phosphoribosylaminoimidazole-succinocarboxamide synthase
VVEPNIPPAPEIEGARHLHSGKVRDLYELTEGPYAGQLLMVASDRISAFDYVLDTVIPDKGEILTRMSLWWFDQLAEIVPNHVLSTDVPESVKGRAVICQKLQMFPVECVARGYLTGSGLLDYQATGGTPEGPSVCGVHLPAGLVDGSRLPEAIFTPATKAAVGDHDENVSYEHVARQIGHADAAELRRLTLEVYTRADEIARGVGLMLADTKFEFGVRHDPDHDFGGGRRAIVLADEVLTPDSSRFWSLEDWRPGQAQPSYDKQIVRNWLLENWDKNSGQRPPALPGEVVERTRTRYLEAYERLTGERF